MDCREAEELFFLYLLGAMDERERRLMNSHLESCDACSVALHSDGQTVASFAFELPQLEVSSEVSRKLFKRVERYGRLASRIIMQAEGLGVVSARPLCPTWPRPWHRP